MGFGTPWLRLQELDPSTMFLQQHSFLLSFQVSFVLASFIFFFYFLFVKDKLICQCYLIFLAFILLFFQCLFV